MFQKLVLLVVLCCLAGVLGEPPSTYDKVPPLPYQKSGRVRFPDESPYPKDNYRPPVDNFVGSHQSSSSYGPQNPPSSGYYHGGGSSGQSFAVASSTGVVFTSTGQSAALSYSRGGHFTDDEIDSYRPVGAFSGSYSSGGFTAAGALSV